MIFGDTIKGDGGAEHRGCIAKRMAGWGLDWNKLLPLNHVVKLALTLEKNEHQLCI